LFKVSGKASAVPFGYQCDVIQIGEKYVNIYDTTGLNQQSSSSGDTWNKLFDFVHELDITLLVFVMRFRITQEALEIYHFLRYIFGPELTMIVAITGLEFERDLVGWWKRNEEHFSTRGMIFQGHSFGTAKPQLSFDQSYSAMQESLLQCIHQHFLGPTTPMTIKQFARSVAGLEKAFNASRNKVRALKGSSPDAETLAFDYGRSGRRKAGNIERFRSFARRLVWFLRNKVMRKVPDGS
jgi:hypothetical protein